MTGVSRSPSRRIDPAFHRYLKPGALAQIRNSRINARSHSLLTRSSSSQRFDSPPSPPSPSPPSPQILSIDHVPDLFNKIYGPCTLRRKKLVAARSVSLINLNASSTSLLESPGANSSVLNSEVVAAH